MKKLTILLGLLIVCTAAAQSKSTTATPAFTSASTTTNVSGWLTTTFKETGLNPAELDVTYEFSAYAVGTYGCVSRKSVTQLGQVAALETSSQTMQISSNGTVRGGMALEPPGPQAGWSCPSGTTLALLQVSYSTVALQDTTNGVTAPLTGTCAAGCTDVLVTSN